MQDGVAIMNKEIVEQEKIQKKIYTIRNTQVMLDRDLAVLYGIETRVLKQAVKRNIKRFPDDFMFVLNSAEIDFLVSQSVIPSRKFFGGAKPYAFTEQGIAMLSSVLKSEKAIKVNIQIMRAFVAMRKFIIKNVEIFTRLDRVEYKLIEHDKRIETLFRALEGKDTLPSQGIFFNGQVFDAYKFVSDLIRKAKKSIILIDNYIDDSVLMLMSKRKKNVKAVIYTARITEQLKLDLIKHNSQYPAIEIKKFKKAHDRFLIIDDTEIFHIGASLKDAGKKWFAFSRMDKESLRILGRLGLYKLKVNNEK